MNLMVSVTDGITPELNRIAAQMRRPRAMLAAMGKRLEKELRDFYAAKDKEPNAKGWPKQHFWARTVRANTALTEVTDTSATVTIASPELAHRVEGGVVTPKRAKLLAIPAHGDAYKMGSPREHDVDFLKFIPLKRGRLRGLLVNREATKLVRKKGGGFRGEAIKERIWFYLVTSVTHEPDPNALPRTEELEAALLVEAQAALDRELARR